jgi:hypothetical protein
MDPDATLTELIAYLDHHDLGHYRALVGALVGWLDRGGFLPDLSDPAARACFDEHVRPNLRFPPAP